MVKRKKSTT